MTQRAPLVIVVVCCVAPMTLFAGDILPTARFEESLLAKGYGYAYAVQAADIDGDGDLDLTSPDTTRGIFHWYENDGKANFTPRTIRKDEEGWMERHRVADLNGDGRLDIAVVKNKKGEIVWLENHGDLTSDRAWPAHVVTSDFPRAYDLEIVELNGDDRPDIAAASWIGDSFEWFENPGPKSNAEWKRHPIDEGVRETRTIRAADFNHDGRPDLLGTARLGDLTAWYENTGKADQRKWPRHVIDDESPQPTHGHPVDMDGDGDIDVVMALGMKAAIDRADTHQVVWYENVGRKGTGRVWRKHLIGSLPKAYEATPALLRGLDRRNPDVVATSWSTGRVVWFENASDHPKGWIPHVLKENWTGANQVIAADLDGDKRLDIIATAERGSNELRWWKNRVKQRYNLHTVEELRRLREKRN